MLKNFQVNGFKSLLLESPLDLSEISVLCGANSSGKSSVIQAILMLSQSLSSRYRASIISLNGANVRLGSFNDIKNHKKNNGNISISFAIDPAKLISPNFRHTFIDCKLKFGSMNTKPGDDDIYHPMITEFSLKLRRNSLEGEIVESISATRDPEDTSMVQDRGLTSNFLINELDILEVERILREYPDAKILSCEGNAFLPNFFKIEYDHSKRKAEATTSALLGREVKPSRSIEEEDTAIPGKIIEELKSIIKDEATSLSYIENMPDSVARTLGEMSKKKRSTIEDAWKELASNIALPADTIPEYISSKKSISTKEWNEFINQLDAFSRMRLTNIIEKRRADIEKKLSSIYGVEKKLAKAQSNTLTLSLNILTSYFSRSIKYLGPLRNEPQPVYSSVGHADPTSVGLKGEYAVAALHINKERIILYPSPPSEADDHKPSNQLKRATLQVACTEWLSHLGIVTEFVTRDKGKLGYSIDVKTAGDDSWHDLTHVGVGVSQVIPIVVMLLLSASGDLLIFEQPELHLHPLVQSRLTDMYWAMTTHGRQCMIETHSEYIINRIRLRIAQTKATEGYNSPLIYFITKDSGSSHFQEVKVNKYGSIQNWPEDFFDQSDRETERILMEGALKRKSEKETYR